MTTGTQGAEEIKAAGEVQAEVKEVVPGTSTTEEITTSVSEEVKATDKVVEKDKAKDKPAEIVTKEDLDKAEKKWQSLHDRDVATAKRENEDLKKQIADSNIEAQVKLKEKAIIDQFGDTPEAREQITRTRTQLVKDQELTDREDKVNKSEQATRLQGKRIDANNLVADCKAKYGVDIDVKELTVESIKSFDAMEARALKLVMESQADTKKEKEKESATIDTPAPTGKGTPSEEAKLKSRYPTMY